MRVAQNREEWKRIEERMGVNDNNTSQFIYREYINIIYVRMYMIG